MAPSVQPFRPDEFHRQYTKGSQKVSLLQPREYDAGVCIDANPKCEEWAAAGECSHNARYMTGEGTDTAGACRKSCKTCKVCKHGDVQCYHNNRAEAGYLHLSDEVKQMTGLELPVQF